MKWIDETLDAASYMILIGLLAGLSGAYGRERHEGRQPDRNWWLNRILLMPFLAICASAGTAAMKLSGEMTAFVASILSLLAYEAVNKIVARVDRLERQSRGLISKVDDASGGEALFVISDGEDGHSKLQVEVPPRDATPAQLAVFPLDQGLGGPILGPAADMDDTPPAE